MNYIIIIVIICAVFYGTKGSDYRINAIALPWWIFVISGFTISLLGLFKFNDERIMFAGCGILLLAKIYYYWENKHLSSKITTNSESERN